MRNVAAKPIVFSCEPLTIVSSETVNSVTCVAPNLEAVALLLICNSKDKKYIE